MRRGQEEAICHQSLEENLSVFSKTCNVNGVKQNVPYFTVELVYMVMN